MRIAFIISLLMWLGISFLVTGCSFQVGIDYFGKTGVDKRVQTELVKKK